MKFKSIVCIIIILIVTVLFGVWINKNDIKTLDEEVVVDTENNDLASEEVKITTQNAINELSINSLDDIKIYISEKEIGIDELSVREKYLKDTTGSNNVQLNKVIIEAIKHEIVLKEAKVQGINMAKDEDSKRKIAEGMYEHSDKTLSKEKYVEKWVKIQIENDIKSVYMADMMEKIAKKQVTINNEEANQRMKMYEINATSENLMAAYEAFVEAKMDEYQISIEKNNKVIYKNY